MPAPPGRSQQTQVPVYAGQFRIGFEIPAVSRAGALQIALWP
jgi:hypothetical protein